MSANQVSIDQMIANMKKKPAKPASQEEAKLPTLNMPFDPVQRARDVEKIVMQGDKRRYYRFRYQAKWWAPVVADSVGCCLGCAYCWNHTRNQAMKGTFMDASEVAVKMDAIGYMHDSGAYRTGGCEPILGEASLNHFIELLHQCRGANKFLLESNGMMLGYHPEWIDMLLPFRDILKYRVSAKADSPEMFERISGADRRYFGVPFEGLRYAQRLGFDCELAYMPEFSDPRKLKKNAKWNGEMDGENLKLYPGVKDRLENRCVWKSQIKPNEMHHTLDLPGMNVKIIEK